MSDAAIQAIRAPTLVLNGGADVVLPGHALALSHVLPHAQLAILPGTHGEYLGEICARNPSSKIPALVTTVIEEFLDTPMQELNWEKPFPSAIKLMR